MIIDGTDIIIGRLAAYVAKKSLEGEKIDIINAEKTIITGSKKDVFGKYKHRRERGTPSAGPFFPRKANLILKRTIRGMLPYKKSRGEEALKRIKCFIGVPKIFEGKEFKTLKSLSIAKLETKKYLTLSKLAKLLGAK
ncbi:MAG: 50S ribosomal protein L13 [Nanoarchaeota archaeon]|nr:50S ribosomal protein L13 [Nanoarchaeota archaeon]